MNLHKTFSFTTALNGRANVLISEVTISQAFKPDPSKDTYHISGLNTFKYRAIWDTGATNTVITEKVVKECGLQATGMVMVAHAQGEAQCNTYLISVGLPNNILIPSLKVTQGKFGEGNNANVLIGMDLIGLGDFAVTNFNNKTVFSFRTPSVEFIDFTGKMNVKTPQSGLKVVGRNDPCPCGSGKKYKKCHGQNIS